ncbi:hypothetical protein AQS8620_01142 [Aquimixticola soesokkakensis]|uniref:Uncharacterized protein n=1 Tax=Aquimixticola soesokkakensis TaxID=1519096 RepID=A0A1Y5SA02_9RHOB|nr:hypothetical protein AQS8620_01142 [Aquimixticola soesokkakensis]
MSGKWIRALLRRIGFPLPFPSGMSRATPLAKMTARLT